MAEDLDKLVEQFKRFPGVGPRQARRMVYYLFRQNRTWVKEMADGMLALKERIALCDSCFRHFLPHRDEATCDICSNPNRSNAVLMIVEKDVDFENIERSRVFDGKYFVLGGTVSLLDKEPEKLIHIDDLIRLVKARAEARELKEVILACSTAPAGEETAQYVAGRLGALLDKHTMTLTKLGRGLSTGAELEYADSETLKNAFQNRK